MSPKKLRLVLEVVQMLLPVNSLRKARSHPFHTLTAGWAASGHKKTQGSLWWFPVLKVDELGLRKQTIRLFLS